MLLWAVLSVCMGAVSTMAMHPRARLKVVQRGSLPWQRVEAQIAEVTRALKHLVRDRVCDEEEGCLVVEIKWEPRQTGCESSMAMSLIMEPPVPGEKQQAVLNTSQVKEEILRRRRVADLDNFPEL